VNEETSHKSDYENPNILSFLINALFLYRRDIREAESKTSLAFVIEKTFLMENGQQMYDLYLPEGRKEATTKTLWSFMVGSWVGDDKKLINGIVARLQKVFQTMREST
jgi:hypothetical protein